MDMTKRIIVEGPDGAGKSTFIDAVRARFPWVEFFPPYKLVAPDMDFETYMGLATGNAGPVYPRIHDRLFYSELVYGPIIRSKIDLTPQRVRYYRSLLGDTAFLVYCRLPYDELVKRVTVNDQMAGVLDNLHHIYRDYDAIIGDNSSRYWARNAYAMYDQTPDSLDKALQLIGEYLG